MRSLSWRSTFALVTSAVGALVALGTWNNNGNVDQNRRALKGVLDPRTMEYKEVKYVPITAQSPYIPPVYNLSSSASHWCHNQQLLPPVDYEQCDASLPVNMIRLSGGLTNGLKVVLLGALLSMEQNRCFYVEENCSHLRNREREEDQMDSFIERYFELIGLPRDHEIVTQAYREGRIQEYRPPELFEGLNRRPMWKVVDTIRGLAPMDGHALKRMMLRKMWRPLNSTRETACQTMDERHGLSEDYLAFSIRRGDKTLEDVEYTKMEDYISAGEAAIQERFAGVAPKIFVASDDCTALPELRALRPDWNFVSECDYQGENIHGFALKDTRYWTLAETDAHFHKFFVELFAMVGSKYLIGVSYTNVSWWVFFMKGEEALNDMKMIDVKPEDERKQKELWR